MGIIWSKDFRSFVYQVMETMQKSKACWTPQDEPMTKTLNHNNWDYYTASEGRGSQLSQLSCILIKISTTNNICFNLKNSYTTLFDIWNNERHCERSEHRFLNGIIIYPGNHLKRGGNYGPEYIFCSDDTLKWENKEDHGAHSHRGPLGRCPIAHRASPTMERDCGNYYNGNMCNRKTSRLDEVLWYRRSTDSVRRKKGSVTFLEYYEKLN